MPEQAKEIQFKGNQTFKIDEIKSIHLFLQNKILDHFLKIKLIINIS
jgi:hypothetical protein